MPERRREKRTEGEHRMRVLVESDNAFRGHPPSYDTWWVNTAGPEYSAITDVNLEPMRVNGRANVKAVRHVKYSTKKTSLARWHHMHGGPGSAQPFRWIEPTDTWWIPSHGDIMRELVNHFRVPDSVIRDAGIAAWKAFEVQFPPELSIANFGLELREVGQLIPKIKDSLVKSASGAYLGFKFGWEPLLGDLGKLGSLMSSIDARLEFLKKTYGKVTRLGLSQTVEGELLGNLTPWIWSGNGSILMTVKHQFDIVKATIRVGALFTHKLPWLNDIQGQIRAFTGALGLNNPLQIVWQALPYSFVVDWFLNVSGALDQLSTFQDKTAEWTIWNVHHSVKTEVIGRFIQQNRPDVQQYIPLNHTMGSFKVTRYERKKGYPTPMSMFSTSSLNPRQLSLLAAMITS